MKLGDNIFKLRKDCKLSQEQLAEKVDVTRQTISNWELGETSPNPEQLKLLSKALNVSIDELLNNDIKQVLVEKVNNTEKYFFKRLPRVPHSRIPAPSRCRIFPSGRIGFQFVDELSLQREIFEKNDSPAAEKWVGKDIPLKK